MTARLKVVNLTAWRTDDLRAFLRTGLAAIGARPDKVVTVKYGRGRKLGQAEIGGHGYTEARRIALFVPRPPLPLDPILYAKTLAHECAHNFGLRHDSIAGGCNVHGVADSEVAWAAGLTIRAKDAERAVPRDIRLHGYLVVDGGHDRRYEGGSDGGSSCRLGSYASCGGSKARSQGRSAS